MNRSISFVVLGAVALSLATGCSNKEKEVIGTWKYKSMDLPASATSGPGAAMAQSLLSGITVEFKADHTYNMTAIFPITGAWSLEGNNVNMTIKTMMGMDIEQIKKQYANNPQASAMMAKNDPSKPQVATLSEDGKTLTMSGPGGQKGSLILAKAGS